MAGFLNRPAAKITRTDAAKALEVMAKERGAIFANGVMAYTRACMAGR